MCIGTCDKPVLPVVKRRWRQRRWYRRWGVGGDIAAGDIVDGCMGSGIIDTGVVTYMWFVGCIITGGMYDAVAGGVCGVIQEPRSSRRTSTCVSVVVPFLMEP